jgi:hypothetical protein
MKNERKKRNEKEEEIVPRNKMKKFSRGEVKNKLQNWENENWEQLGGDDIKGEQNVPRNDKE